MPLAFILLLIFLPSSAFSTLKKLGSSSFTYENISDSHEQKTVQLTGITESENIAIYAENAIRENRQTMRLDKELDVNIDSVMVVKLFLKNSAHYNGVIAYVIRTTDGRILFHFPYIIADHIRVVETEKLQTIRTLAQSFGMQTTSGNLLIPGISGDMNQFTSYGPLASLISSASQPVAHHIWATVELYSECVRHDTLQIPNRSPFSYQVIENSSFYQP